MQSIKIFVDTCPQHQLNQQYLCFNMYCKQKIIKLCEKCIPNHQKHKQSIYQVHEFSDKIESVYECTHKVFKETKQFHEKIEKYIEKIKKVYKERQDAVLKKLLIDIQNQKLLIDQYLAQLEQIQKELKSYYIIQGYFEKLQANNLLLTRLKLCSAKGHEKFQSRHQQYTELTESSGQMKIINLFLKFFQKVKILKSFLSNNLQSKIQTLVKNSISKFSSIKDTNKTSVSENVVPI